MKKVIVMLALLAMAPVAMAQITGSAHDFSGLTWAGGPGGEICNVCHTPHGADVSVSDAPLWNHEVTAATFTLYTSTTLDSTVAQPGGVSKLCLSCHDGTVALDNFGGATGGTTDISAANLVGTNLNQSHPIAIAYSDTHNDVVSGDLKNPVTEASGIAGTIQEDMLFGGDQVECSSCHDVHNGAGIDKLLVKTNAASVLCLTCHVK